MRIDLFNSMAGQVSNEAGTQQISGQSSTAPSSAGGEDRTTLTSDSTSVESLVSNALQTPEIRQNQVDSLKQAISSGQYQLDPGKIAGAMVDEQA